MGVKLGTSCLNWTHPTLPSLKRCSFSDGALVFKHLRKLDNRSSIFSNHHNKNRSKLSSNSIRRSCSAGADSSSPFSNEEFAKELQELARRFNIPNVPIESELLDNSDSGVVGDDQRVLNNNRLDERPEWSDWPLEPTGMIIPAGIEWKASSVELPLSLRIIKRKRQWQEGFREAGESAKCSVKKAFSSMVFIIRELQCFAIQTRETILYEDMQGILSHVQQEMHASFVWLFQQVFSRTPTLMVYVMILLANYSVYSMTSFAAPPPPTSVTETVSITDYSTNNNNFDKSSARAFYLSSDSGRTESVGGGGGGVFRPVSSGTDGGGKFGSEQTVVPEGGKEEREKESVSGQEMGEEDSRLWDSIVDNAMKMRSEGLEHETLMKFVSPVSAKMESDDYADYFRTELFYQTGLAQDPINPLLLVNYAQFLYLVARDHNRAEAYFKRAVKVKPPDAEALNKYANFLWQAKKDLWGAEENYLDAISADPTNSYYAANYAHFLWNTGGEDTCFPIDAPDINCNNA